MTPTPIQGDFYYLIYIVTLGGKTVNTLSITQYYYTFLSETVEINNNLAIVPANFVQKIETTFKTKV